MGDVTRSQQKELRVKAERDAANEAINQVRTEEEEFKQFSISNQSAAEELITVRDHSHKQSSSSGRKSLGSDIPMSPRSGATLYQGAVEKHAGDTGTAMTIARSLLPDHR